MENNVRDIHDVFPVRRSVDKKILTLLSNYELGLTEGGILRMMQAEVDHAKLSQILINTKSKLLIKTIEKKNSNLTLRVYHLLSKPCQKMLALPNCKAKPIGMNFVV